MHVVLRGYVIGWQSSSSRKHYMLFNPVQNISVGSQGPQNKVCNIASKTVHEADFATLCSLLSFQFLLHCIGVRYLSLLSNFHESDSLLPSSFAFILPALWSQDYLFDNSHCHLCPEFL
jgi:hypothetical protein